MKILAIICYTAALITMIFAVVYQRKDIDPDHGGTMGGEMTTGFIWILASLLCAVGSVALIPWYLSIFVFFLVLAISFLVRTLVSRIPKHPG
jgi:phosphatidylglycerophosphate synthase